MSKAPKTFEIPYYRKYTLADGRVIRFFAGDEFSVDPKAKQHVSLADRVMSGDIYDALFAESEPVAAPAKSSSTTPPQEV